MKNKLDKWADSKTQKEFDNFIIKFIIAPVFILFMLLTAIIDIL